MKTQEMKIVQLALAYNRNYDLWEDDRDNFRLGAGKRILSEMLNIAKSKTFSTRLNELLSHIDRFETLQAPFHLFQDYQGSALDRF